MRRVQRIHNVNHMMAKHAGFEVKDSGGVTQLIIGDVCLFIYMDLCSYVILYFDTPYFCVHSAFDPVPKFTKQNPLV